MTYGRDLVQPLPGGARGQAWQRRTGSSTCARRTNRASAAPLLPRPRRRHRPSSRSGSAATRCSALDPEPARAAAAAAGDGGAAAICGQLIEARRALAIERAILRALGDPAPLRDGIAALSPAQLRRLGLATHRASTLVRVCRSIDLEGLRGRPLEAVEARLLRERGLGPWSLGVIALEGLGSFRHGLVGDLGLVKLCSALWGRWVDTETAELLAPYQSGRSGRGLPARGWSAGLVPGANADLARLAHCRAA